MQDAFWKMECYITKYNVNNGGELMYSDNYKEKKEKLREEAIRWQHEFSKHEYSYRALAEKQAYFKKEGKCYGLIREFKENAIL